MWLQGKNPFVTKPYTAPVVTMITYAMVAAPPKDTSSGINVAAAKVNCRPHREYLATQKPYRLKATVL